MNQDTTAALLNTIVLTKISPSPIDGVGVFAIRDIQIGQRLYLDSLPRPYRISKGSLDKLFPEVREILVGRFPRVFVDSVVAYPDGCYQAYINHSEKPNYDPRTDTVIREIKTGEEITENYRDILGWQEAFPWLDEK